MLAWWDGDCDFHAVFVVLACMFVRFVVGEVMMLKDLLRLDEVDCAYSERLLWLRAKDKLCVFRAYC